MPRMCYDIYGESSVARRCAHAEARTYARGEDASRSTWRRGAAACSQHAMARAASINRIVTEATATLQEITMPRQARLSGAPIRAMRAYSSSDEREMSADV